MKFTVDQIDILSSKAGDGIIIGDKIIGCAVIKSFVSEEGSSMKSFVEEGLCAKYNFKPKEGSNEVETELDFSDIANGNNYVLFTKNKETDENNDPNIQIILNTVDITRLFGLPDSDATMMSRYLGALANQKHLILQTYDDLDTGDNGIFFVNQFDREINDLILDDRKTDAFDNYQHIVENHQYYVDLSTHSFIKTFLMTVVQSGQDRYNKLHRLDVLTNVAKELAGITYWEDGILKSPSVMNINDYLKEIPRFIQTSKE